MTLHSFATRSTLAQSRLRSPPAANEYVTLSREQAEREGAFLVAVCSDTGLWKHLPEHLVVLRGLAEPPVELARAG